MLRTYGLALSLVTGALAMASCAPAYPEKTCLPNGALAGAAADGAQKGPVTLYFDASGSMAGYLNGATPDVRPLQDLIATIPGSTAGHATKVSVVAFGRELKTVAAADVDSLAAATFYRCAGPRETCNNQESRIDEVFRTIAGKKTDELSVVVTDLWLSNSSLIATPAVALGQPIEQIFAKGHSVVVLGIRAPFQGVMTASDFPSGQGYPDVRQRPLFVLIIGPAQRALAYRDSLLRLQSESFAGDRLKSAVFSAADVVSSSTPALSLAPGSSGLEADQVISPRYRLNVPQFSVAKAELRRAPLAKAEASINLSTLAPPDVVWRGGVSPKTTVWRLTDKKNLKACKGAWTKVRDVEGAWRSQGDRMTFTLDGTRPEIRGLAPGHVYAVVGSLARTSLHRPNTATSWMREWSFNAASEASMRASHPAMLPTLNLAVTAAQLEGALDRATPASGRVVAQVSALIGVEQ